MIEIANITSALPLLMFLIAICGCTSIKDDADIRSSDVPLEVATETPDIGWEIPSNYFTHTDSTGLFSVSYPPDWKENPNPRGVDLLSTEYLTERRDAEDPIDQVGPVFFWGVPTVSDYNPSCSVVAEPRPDSIGSIQQVMEEQIAMMYLLFNEFTEVSLETLVHDGREAAVLEYEANLNGVEAQSLVLFTIVGDTIWTNGCLVQLALADFSEYETDFQNIVRSLKVHR